MQQRQLRAKWLLCSARFVAFVSSLKLSWRLLCVSSSFQHSTSNEEEHLSLQSPIWANRAVCVKAKAPADHVYQRRTWDEFKRVLSVAHASQPVERAENLEYRNKLSGVCWGAVYCSNHKDLRSESIFLNHPVCVCVCVAVTSYFTGNYFRKINRQRFERHVKQSIRQAAGCKYGPAVNCQFNSSQLISPKLF